MPTLDWLKKEFSYGYSSGEILSPLPNLRRWHEERSIGGSYRKVFHKAILPNLKLDSTVLELGPGAGSWSRAVLKHIPNGKLITVDFQDSSQWLKPENYGGKLICNRVTDNSFDCIKDNSIDFFFSIGVLCHNNQEQIGTILKNSLSKLKPGARSLHQYSDWTKLDNYGWNRGKIPEEFKNKSDDEIWWVRNNSTQMENLAKSVGWNVISADLNFFKRDGLILLERPN